MDNLLFDAFPGEPHVPGATLCCQRCRQWVKNTQAVIDEFARTGDRFALPRFCGPCEREIAEIWREAERENDEQGSLF